MLYSVYIDSKEEETFSTLSAAIAYAEDSTLEPVFWKIEDQYISATIDEALYRISKNSLADISHKLQLPEPDKCQHCRYFYYNAACLHPEYAQPAEIGCNAPNIEDCPAVQDAIS